MKKFIQNYEENSKEVVTKELVDYLYENIDKSDELKKVYKEVLEELGKYDNNYYSKMCIIINVLKLKKSQNKILKFPYDIYYLNLPLKGTLEIRICGKKHEIKTAEKLVEYENINSKFENLGEEKNKEEKEKLIKEAEKVLSNKVIDMNEGISWKEKYKKYIIRTYGRWSSQYEDYMMTLFDVGFLPTGPNLVLSINRQHMRDAITDKLAFLKKI